MSIPIDLPAQAAEKTNEQLLAMFQEPDDWLPEALDVARVELRRRGVDADAASLQSAAIEVDIVPNQRPLAITAVCIFGFIGGPITMLMGIYYLLRPVITLPPWHAGFMIFAGAWRLGCMIGLWRMSRIAFFALVLHMCTNLVVLLIFTPRAIASAIIPFVIQLAIGSFYFRRLK